MTPDRADGGGSVGAAPAAGREARFAFGANWRRFLEHVGEERIEEAVRSLRDLLGVSTLDGRTFLDIGCGSGLFSLAARRLGAVVHSFDYDPESVACARELRRRFAPDDVQWTIESGSALDAVYLRGLGAFDVVYSWGVLHHTGDLWTALENAALPVGAGGRLVVSLYNDQGLWSRYWLWVKRTYNGLPRPLRLPFALVFISGLEARVAVYALVTLRPLRYVRAWTEYGRNRGMSRWHDLLDWVGGYPFEVARPDEVFDFYRKRGFSLVGLKTCAGKLGCNEFVFERMRPHAE